MVTAIIAACSTTVGPGPTPTVPGQAPGTSPVPTSWPGNTVTAIIALAAADSSFAKLGSDLQTTIDNSDMAGLLQVSTDGLTFLKGAQQNIKYVQEYADTRALGDALANGYQQMIDGLQQVHDSLAAGNPDGVTAGFQAFVAGSTTYGAVRADLSDKAQQAVFMQRNFLR